MSHRCTLKPERHQAPGHRDDLRLVRHARRKDAQGGSRRKEASVNLATEEASVNAEASVTADALAAAVRKAGYDVATTETALGVEGMTCASCVSRVEKALRKVPGVSSAAVNLATEKATIQALSTVPVSTLKAAIEKAGYAVKDLQEDKPKAAPRLPVWWPVAVSTALTLPLVAPMLL